MSNRRKFPQPTILCATTFCTKRCLSKWLRVLIALLTRSILTRLCSNTKAITTSKHNQHPNRRTKSLSWRLSRPVAALWCQWWKKRHSRDQAFSLRPKTRREVHLNSNSKSPHPTLPTAKWWPIRRILGARSQAQTCHRTCSAEAMRLSASCSWMKWYRP